MVETLSFKIQTSRKMRRWEKIAPYRPKFRTKCVNLTRKSAAELPGKKRLEGFNALNFQGWTALARWLQTCGISPRQRGNQSNSNQIKKMSTLHTWNPYRDLETLQNRMFRSFGLAPANRRENGGSVEESAQWTPAVDITEDEKEYLVVAELPQIAKEDVNVVIENDSLVIKGERRFESDHADRKVHRIERSYGRFHRSSSLPEDADGNGVIANFKDGVLRVSLPKREKKKSKQIEVKVG